MEHQKIDDKARVWVLTRGIDGRLKDELDPQFLTSLGAAFSAEDVADVIAVAAGEMKVAEHRAW